MSSESPMSSETNTEPIGRSSGVAVMLKLPMELKLLVSRHFQDITDSFSQHHSLLKELAASYPGSPYIEMHTALADSTKDTLYLGSEADWYHLVSVAHSSDASSRESLKQYKRLVLGHHPSLSFLEKHAEYLQKASWDGNIALPAVEHVYFGANFHTTLVDNPEVNAMLNQGMDSFEISKTQSNRFYLVKSMLGSITKATNAYIDWTANTAKDTYGLQQISVMRNIIEEAVQHEFGCRSFPVYNNKQSSVSIVTNADKDLGAFSLHLRTTIYHQYDEYWHTDGPNPTGAMLDNLMQAGCGLDITPKTIVLKDFPTMPGKLQELQAAVEHTVKSACAVPTPIIIKIESEEDRQQRSHISWTCR
jgi:hypothetical protein